MLDLLPFHMSTAELVEVEAQLLTALRNPTITLPQVRDLLQASLERTQRAIGSRRSPNPALPLPSEAAAHSHGAGAPCDRAAAV